MVLFDLKVLAKFGLRKNYSGARLLVLANPLQLLLLKWNGTTLKHCDVHEKFNFLKIQDLRPLNSCQKHFEMILLIFL